MARKKKTWLEKLNDSKDLPKIQTLDGKKKFNWPEGTYLIPAPLGVDEVMRKVPKGKLVTVNEIRAFLADKHGADYGCPITTGIFAWIAANAAEEQAQAGRKRITPYWRTLKAKGELNPKYPGGVEKLREKLEAEGHEVFNRGRKMYVKNFEKSLAKLQ